jgi:AraC-like DNA-binding protein
MAGDFIPSPQLRRLAAIADRADKPLTLAQVSARLGLSERALRKNCQENFGMSPTQYLRHRRLARARADLLAAPPGATVTTIAIALGFGELGRFAAYYAAAFGELPSQTLSRRPRDLHSTSATRSTDQRAPEPAPWPTRDNPR